MALPPDMQHTGASNPVPLAGALDGSKYVANPVGGNPGQGQSPSAMLQQMWQQAGGQNYQQLPTGQAGQQMQDYWNQFGGGSFTPRPTGQGSQQVNQAWQQAGGATYNPVAAGQAGQQVTDMWNSMGGGSYTPGNRTSLESMFGNVGANQQNFDPTVDIVNQTMGGILNPGNAYIDSARRAGMEQAAARGGLNSSIGAGASQRAAVDASMPMFQSAMGLTGQREQQAWQGRESELARALQQQGMKADMIARREQQDFQGAQSDLDRALQRTGQAMSLEQAREQYNFQGTQADLDRAQQRAGQATSLDQARDQMNFQGQQSAFDRALTMAGQAMSLDQAREQFNFQGNQADLDRAAQRARDALNLTSQREGMAFQGQQAGLDRIQNVNNQMLQQELRERQSRLDSALAKDLRQDQTAQQDWLASQDYTRRFNGSLAMMPIESALGMQNALLQFAASDPEVFTPQVLSGMTNFFQGNMTSMLQQYFPNMVRPGSTS